MLVLYSFVSFACVQALRDMVLLPDRGRCWHGQDHITHEHFDMAQGPEGCLCFAVGHLYRGPVSPIIQGGPQSLHVCVCVCLSLPVL